MSIRKLCTCVGNNRGATILLVPRPRRSKYRIETLPDIGREAPPGGENVGSELCSVGAFGAMAEQIAIRVRAASQMALFRENRGRWCWQSGLTGRPARLPRAVALQAQDGHRSLKTSPRPCEARGAGPLGCCRGRRASGETGNRPPWIARRSFFIRSRLGPRARKTNDPGEVHI